MSKDTQEFLDKLFDKETVDNFELPQWWIDDTKQAILQHFQQEQEIKSLERAVEWTRHLKRGEELFGRVDWDTALYELERREKWSAGQSMTEEEPKVFTKSEADRLIREAVDAVLDELIEWYEAEKDFSAQPFNWYGAVKSLKVSKDYKKPFDTLSEQKEGSK